MGERVITVFEIGSHVLVGGDIPAQVSAISIRAGQVSYECNWWDDRVHQCQWLFEFEVKPVDDNKTLTVKLRQTKAGFDHEKN